jgi:transcription-repair coupling factor (superfamily II helicase)
MVLFDGLAGQAHEERVAQIQDFYEARRTLENAAGLAAKKKKSDVSLTGAVYHPLLPLKLYIGDKEWADILGAHDTKTLSSFGAPENMPGMAEGGGRKGRDFGDIRALPDGDVLGAVRDHIRDIAATRKVLIACYSEGSKERLKTMLSHSGVSDLKDCEHYTDVAKLKSGQTGLAIIPLESGFVADDLAVMTEQDILGDRLARRASKRRKSDNFLTEVSSLNEGDLVVHIDHGVGRFEGLETLKAAGTVHDCLKIVYEGGDKLFVPVENIEVLTRFGSDEGITHLDKLGGAGWQARKARVKKDLMIMAEGLLKIAAAREMHRAQRLTIDKDHYNSFAARFPYQETEDQLRSIDAVVADLDNPRPMDRLVCGDVGFGKTEVALRAAYVAAKAGSQVAVAVPTTLLARQHYNNFIKRFEGSGIRVGQLSRLTAAKDAKLTKDGLTDGAVSIVIGTHALFAKDVKFANLGLVIVDEEQRFGVKQKEKLKELKADVHVLTLTATPIPRTLQMALTGVKDMSLITTPPVDRLAIRTFVLPFDPLVIREAILREHYRGGQTFYVCPRISDMRELEEQLKELVPEVKVITAHGQMTPTDLEDRMSAFYDGQYDILLTTQIIESGIDIPTANTMIIHRADMFGLAQLYQIRGRIGRSRVRAYAYLTFDPHKKLTSQALKRLEVIETLDTLGSGFQLASHDMDIRGAGNLLGEEQSGHIREVGVELYQQMLEEAVAVARAGGDELPVMQQGWSPQINMGTSVLIPESYVQDLGVRMSLYRRLADLETKTDLEGFAAEMIDRFGKLPQEVENLLDIVAIKQFCRKAGIDKVEAGPKGAVLGFYKDTPPNIPGLMEWIAGYKGAVKLRHDQKIVVVRHWEETEQRVQGIQVIVQQLAKLAP